MPRSPQVDLDRFWPKVDRTESCWLWTASRITGGYGAFSWCGRTRGAHRFAYETFVGQIPPGQEVDHLCHVRLCVNPAHLELTTHAQNSQNRAGASRVSQSGYRGVFPYRNGRWRVSVQVAGRTHRRYSFATAEEADLVARQLRRDLMTHSRADSA